MFRKLLDASRAQRQVFRVFPVILLAAPGIEAVPTQESGPVTVQPDNGVAGQFGTWKVIYRVGPEGMVEGSSIRVQLPDSWHAGDRNSANRLQASDPEGDFYVSASATGSPVELSLEVENEPSEFLVKSARPSLDGRSERYVFVVRASVVKGELTAGQTLTVTYGDRSGGSRGFRAPVIATEPEPVLVAADPSGSGEFKLISNRSTLRAHPGPPAEMILRAPSILQIGRPALLRLALVDENANPTPSELEHVQLGVLTGEAQLHEQLQLPLEKGWAGIEFTPRASGILRIEGSARGGILKARANPIRVVEKLPRRMLYWGDLHSHSRYSWDGVGSDPFSYARNVSGLDFYAMTDHSRSNEDGRTRGLGPHVWQEYIDLTEANDEPGRFVTLHAYEASFGSPYGHHNVYFRSGPGRLLSPEEFTLEDFWRFLDAGEVLTIPHHTGKFPTPVRWDIHDDHFRRNLEIYSAHGLSEAYDPDHPLSFEHSDFTGPSKSAQAPQSAQDAWIRGLVLSAIASSDDHRAQPGKPHWGLAAVWATGLTRAEIFDGLYDRHTYATTGTRILLEFSVNDTPMGRSVEVSSPPLLRVEAHGTDVVEKLEVLRYCRSDGAFKVIFQADPDALDFVWQNLDAGIQEDSIYYVRLTQRNYVHGRPVMAWSSPIWVRYSE